MNFGGLVPCRRLYRVSNWKERALGVYVQDAESDSFRRVSADTYEHMLMNGYAPVEEVPAYTVGFVLEAIVKHSSLEPAGVLRMLADDMQKGESFSNAACRLAVELFASGVLEREA